LLLTVSLLLPRLAAGQEVKWRHDYNAARREAEEKGRPLVLDFGTQNCFWCRKLDEITFRDPTVLQLLNDKFIPLKIDGERETQLTHKLGIQVYPTIILAAPEGKILATLKGFQDVANFTDILQRVLTSVTNPEWMLRDYQAALAAVKLNEPGRAVALLRTILEDGKRRPVQQQAAKMLADLEQQAAEKLLQARLLQDKGHAAPALTALTELVRDYAGTPAAREAAVLLTSLHKSVEDRAQDQQRRARDLLAQAREHYQQQEFLPCLERCELLLASHGDQPEAGEALQMATAIKENPRWLQKACEGMSDRLGSMYLALADAWTRRGQAEQAIVYLERILRTFPGSRHAEIAQLRLDQLQARPVTGAMRNE
jgi:thioredoxin-related protein/outer membrane protein assembly factor BamD (BamD/ComL family)